MYNFGISQIYVSVLLLFYFQMIITNPPLQIIELSIHIYRVVFKLHII